jgi:hypothetical protein
VENDKREVVLVWRGINRGGGIDVGSKCRRGRGGIPGGNEVERDRIGGGRRGQ